MLGQNLPLLYLQRHPATMLHILLFSYLVLSPFYIFKSGLPQPADMIMLGAVIAGVGTYSLKIPLTFSRTGVAIMMFLLLVTAVNLANYYFFRDQKMIFAIAFYVYNVGVFAFISILFLRNYDKTLNTLRLGLTVSLVLEFIYVFFVATLGDREPGTFNNPNQLGYFAILVPICLYLLHDKPKYQAKDFILLGMAGYIGFMSLSKAMILTYPIILLLYICSKKTSHMVRLPILGFMLISLLGIGPASINLVSIFRNIDVLNTVLLRLDTIGQEKDDSLEGRGYDRLANSPEYIVLGAGEGAHKRFDPRGQELHSALATILFSYGILGFTFFGFFLLGILARAPASHWILVLTIMSHGLVHQNVRFTLFWVFLAILYATKKEYLTGERPKPKPKTNTWKDYYSGFYRHEK